MTWHTATGQSSPSNEESVTCMHICDLSRETFVQYFSGLYERSSWILERAYDSGLYPAHDNPDVLFKRFQEVLEQASDGERLALLRSYPDLAGKRAQAGQISRAAALEQADAGVLDCSPQQRERFRNMNRLYWARYGFPFIASARDCGPDELLRRFAERLRHDRETELQTGLQEVQALARARLDRISGQIETADVPLPISTDITAKDGIVDDAQLEKVGSGLKNMTTQQMRDPDYFPGIVSGLPLGIQHVLAMFISNVTPAIIVAGAVGFGFGSPDSGKLIYLIQMSMFFAGMATLLQTISIGPVGARLPIVQGTSFAFIPVMIPIAIEFGMAALMGGIIVGGVFHFFLGTFIARLRHLLPPLVTGLVVLMIGLALVRVGVQYAAGGVPLAGQPAYGNLVSWSLASVVILVTLVLKFYTRGMLSVSAVLIGLLAGYALAFYFDMVSFDAVYEAPWFAFPQPMYFGFELNAAAIIGICLMSVISAIETVGDISGVTRTGAGREASDRELAGGTMADGLGTAFSGAFGALPNTSFSQNVGLVSMTGIMSRHVVTIGALFLVACGLVPKVGAVIQTMPIAVLGGGVIVMFGMVSAAGINILSQVAWDKRNMLIFAVALSVGLGLQLEPDALQHLPSTARVLMTSGLLPSAVIAILLNIIVPKEIPDDRSRRSGVQNG